MNAKAFPYGVQGDPLPRVERRSIDAAALYHRCSVGAAVSAFVLIAAGALVTSTGSSLAVPDWPLSFGQVMPPMVGGVFYEHGHRVIAGVVAAFSVVLALWARVCERRALPRRLAYAAAILILVQAVLGGVTVLMRLPPAVSIAHACLGQAVFCILLSLAQATSPRFARSSPARDGSWRLGAAAALALFLQLALGALVRHTGASVRWHIGWAFGAALVLLVLIADGRRRLDGWLSRVSAAAALLLPLQLVLGYATWRIKQSPDFTFGFSAMTALTATHVATGALLLGTAVIYALRATRRPS